KDCEPAITPHVQPWPRPRMRATLRIQCWDLPPGMLNVKVISAGTCTDMGPSAPLFDQRAGLVAVKIHDDNARQFPGDDSPPSRPELPLPAPQLLFGRQLFLKLPPRDAWFLLLPPGREHGPAPLNQDLHRLVD